MPELPEVETVVRHLRKKIRGKRIVDFTATAGAERIFRLSAQANRKNFAEVKKQVLRKKIEGVERIGKNILLRLSGNTCLGIHLMMTGKLLLDPQNENKHDRFIIGLSGRTKLVFNDIRKFGRCRIITDAKKLNGEDALSLNFETFKLLIKDRKTPIKSFFLDQSKIAGIGNIYADEILWQAGVHPARRADSLKIEEIKNIFHAIKTVLRMAIKKGGTSSRDYRKPDGTEGGYYKIRRVYQRTGQKCPQDGARIRKIKINGRSTHFCPKHQK